MKSFTTVAYEELAKELDAYRRERVRITDVLDAFRSRVDKEGLTIAALQPIYGIADQLCGPRE